MEITTVLLDLDGVVRHYDPAHVIAVEQRHGLDQGTLIEAGFLPHVLEPVITGKTTRAAWVAQICDLVGNPTAVQEWLSERGQIDWDLMEIVDELRRQGTTVAVLTNGTDTTSAEVKRFGIADRFDAVFNSAEIGFAKPDGRAFLHVCGRLDVSARQVFFTDDSRFKLAGAIEIGMTARLYEGIGHFRQHLDELLS
jgi:putative hydrolase of the HAD superfamily